MKVKTRPVHLRRGLGLTWTYCGRRVQRVVCAERREDVTCQRCLARLRQIEKDANR
jgi:hypothetical protein